MTGFIHDEKKLDSFMGGDECGWVRGSGKGSTCI